MSASYTFTNTGTGMLRINEVKAGCGCTVPSLSKYDYLPGESGSIEIVFDPKGRKGKSTKYVTVKSSSSVPRRIVVATTGTARIIHFNLLRFMLSTPCSSSIRS